MTVHEPSGYLSAAYAESLSELGAARLLRRSGGWILTRPIPGTRHHDAAGAYPLFLCRDWASLDADLRELDDELVSVSLVTDPFGQYDAADLQRSFPDVMMPFKEHCVVDLTVPPDSYVSAHHQRNARSALEQLQIEPCEPLEDSLPDWTRLYAELIRRHGITGLRAFSSDALARQLRVPGMTGVRALHGGTVVGMLLWCCVGDVAYYHLGASSAAGYEQRASFGLFSFSIQHFARRGLKWLDLGAGAGLSGSHTDGLSRFKRGWATGTRLAYFCGRICDRAAYARIVETHRVPPTTYFPAYRQGEFE